MKRKWRKIQPKDHWLGPVAQKVGMVLEEKRAEPVKKYVFNTWVKPSDPLHQGMVIGHWLVGMIALTGGYSPKRVHICVSHCGVVAGYQPWEIAAGRLPKTCYGCRPGEHEPPSCRVVPECDLPKLQLHWKEPYIMATAFEEKSALDTPAGNDLWMTQGRLVMQEIVNRTSYGAAFGWKVHVRKLVPLPDARPMAHRVKINAIYKGERRFEMFVQAKGGDAGFIVDLATGRNDRPFTEITSEIERAVSILQSLDVAGNYPVEKPKVAAAANGTVAGPTGPIDLSKLLKLRAGIENVLTIGKDYNELAPMKQAARSKVEKANAKKGDLHVAKVKAEEAENAAKAKANAASELVMRCEMSLKNALAARDNALADKNKAVDAATAAVREYLPAEEEAKAAEKDLADLEALEAERLKSVGDVKGLTVLLEALEKMGG